MKTSTLEKRLNEALKENLKKPNKTATFERKGVPEETKEGLADSYDCKAKTFKEFKASKTKIHTNDETMVYLICDLLREAYKSKKVNFTMHHWSRNTYYLIICGADVKAFGFPPEDGKHFFGYKYVTRISFEYKETVFGDFSFDWGKVESEETFAKRGTPELEEVVHKITVKDNIDITNWLKKHMKNSIARNKENEKRFAEQRVKKERK